MEKEFKRQRMGDGQQKTSFVHEVDVSHMSSLKLWLPVEDLNKIKASSILPPLRRDAHEPQPKELGCGEENGGIKDVTVWWE